QVVAKDRDAYQYLVESIRMFPGQNEASHTLALSLFSVCSSWVVTGLLVATDIGFG
ncbi:unnamed protein product, partial [Ectocarpus sp. 8 AP-2014]